MEKMTFNQMENLQGGDLLGGICAVLGGTGAAMGVRMALGATFAIPGWGQIAMAAGGVACMGRGFGIW